MRIIAKWGGVKIPYRWSEVKENVPVDDGKFAKPSAPPEQEKGPAK